MFYWILFIILFLVFPFFRIALFYSLLLIFLLILLIGLRTYALIRQQQRRSPPEFRSKNTPGTPSFKKDSDIEDAQFHEDKP